MKHWMTFLLVLGLAAGKPAWAEVELERSELAGLVKEIDFLLRLFLITEDEFAKSKGSQDAAT